MKKKIKSVIIIFSALIIISANQLHSIIAHGWDYFILIPADVDVKVMQTDFQVISCTGSNMHEPFQHTMKTNRVYIFYKLN